MVLNEISKHCSRFCVKSFKLIRAPVVRLRKLLRKSNMRQMKIAVGVLIIFSCIVTVILYYWNRLSLMNSYEPTEKLKVTTKRIIKGTPIRGIPLDIVYKDVKRHDDKDMFELESVYDARMIDTVGCRIPVVMVDYIKSTRKNTTKRASCGNRAVFVRKVNGNEVNAYIKSNILRKYMKDKGNRFECCHQFILQTDELRREDKVMFSNCTKFEDNSKITLLTDFMTVKCFEYTDKNQTYNIYEDMFALAKKINTTVKNENDTKCQLKYNVLMIGLDSMSLSRAVQTIPRTIDYFKNEFWVSFRGYHKIAENTLPNLMAVLTGNNMSTISRKCLGRMDSCNDFMIWNEFKEAGYVTAYGEDYLELPDTFTKDYQFRKPPTDHYMRPFFLKGERRQKNSTFLCAGMVCSGQQVLDYALDFADTYKRESFFGLFWINSFSHDAKSSPHQADKIIENFFNQLSYTGVLTTTFVIFFSDHGIRFGERRFKMEAYYDDRMPMFFMWLPIYFKGRYGVEVQAVAANQHKLVTPYDIYNTLLDIKQLSVCKNVTEDPPKGCPKCHSVFEIITGNRTCQDVSIHDKWCSCHKLYPLPVQDTEGVKSVDVVVNHITSMVKSIKTQRCWGCMSLTLKTIIRIHFYYDKDKVSLYYVVAFTMSPGNTSYEATVLRRKFEQRTIIGPISVITNYRGLGKCVKSRRDRLFCVCQKIENC